MNSSPCFRLSLATRLRLGVPTLWHADGSHLGDHPLGVFFVRHPVPTGLPSRSIRATPTLGISKYTRAQVYLFKYARSSSSDEYPPSISGHDRGRRAPVEQIIESDGQSLNVGVADRKRVNKE